MLKFTCLSLHVSQLHAHVTVCITTGTLYLPLQKAFLEIHFKYILICQSKLLWGVKLHLSGQFSCLFLSCCEMINIHKICTINKKSKLYDLINVACSYLNRFGKQLDIGFYFGLEYVSLFATTFVVLFFPLFRGGLNNNC